MLRTGDGFKPGKAGQVFKCAGVSIAFDESGAISELTDSHGHAWAGPGHTLAQLKYRSYSAADVGSFFASYCKSNAGWVQHDYGKPGLPDDVLGKIWTTSMSNLWSKQTADGCKRRLLRVRSCGSFGNGRGRVVAHARHCTGSFIAQTAFEPAASEEYGAAAGWTTVEVMAGDRLEVEVGMFVRLQLCLSLASGGLCGVLVASRFLF